MGLLPKVDQYGLYEIRFESIGGLGANLAGKMLSDVGQVLGFNVVSFSSYGSEKKGSPVKAFIRFADPGTEIRIATPIEHPDVLVVFTDAILKNPDVLAGVDEHTVIVLNTRKSAEEVMKIADIPKANLWLVDATTIALEEEVKSNGVLLGALSKATGFIKKEAIVQLFEEVIGKKYPALLQANIKAIGRGFEEVKNVVATGDPSASFKPYVRSGGLGYTKQVIGGTIPNPGNAARKNLSAGRYGWIPLFSAEKCINCGVCNIVCSDQCIVFKPGKDKKTGKDTMNMVGVDYQYCKGCLKCVETCPVKALVEAKEMDYDVSSLTVDSLNKTESVQNNK